MSARCAVSSAPLFSIRRSTANSSGAVISLIGRSPSQGKMFSSKRRITREVWFETQLVDCLASHSLATVSKLFADSSAEAAFAAWRCWLGSMPSDTSFRAASDGRALPSGRHLDTRREIVFFLYRRVDISDATICRPMAKFPGTGPARRNVCSTWNLACSSEHMWLSEAMGATPFEQR